MDRRFSSMTFTGMTRWLVAVGMVRLAAMFSAIFKAGPRSWVTWSSGAMAAGGGMSGVFAVGGGLGGAERAFICGSIVTDGVACGTLYPLPPLAGAAAG